MMSQSPSDDQGEYPTRRFGPVLCRCCDKLFSRADHILQKNIGSFINICVKSRYHSTIQDLRDAIEFGCQLCILIMHEFRQHYKRLHEAICSNDDSTPHWNCGLYLRITKHSWDDNCPVYFELGSPLFSRPGIWLTFNGHLVSSLAYPSISERDSIKRELNFLKKHHSSSYTPPGSTDSPAAWELCRSWINNCTENHEWCKSYRSENPHSRKLPTRLLYIASLGYENLSGDRLNSLNIQLHITQENGFKGSYMTLSHCWGDPKGMLKLTNKNYKKWTEAGFPYRDLPKTFQDAVRLSLFLRNDYLWIDSLCIIQNPDCPVVDDPTTVTRTSDIKTDTEVANEDWVRESKTMADVYRYSKCNIAATASRGPTEGCFYSRQHPTTIVSPL
ncbi:hypothetical protein F4806DRAFT_80283 [Annulohypoxylon nitens]|nr:hypothetical protein F4806DRAFT_80283 [Annulohypoxylon nitens]